MSKFGAVAGGFAVATALVLSGCAAGGDTTEASSGIITVNGSEPQNPLVPANTNEVEGGKVVESVFAGLVYYKADGTPENDLAESITTDDSTTFTVKVAKGHKFTNGEDVTAASFVDAWDWAALASNAALNSYFFEDIVGFSYDEDSHIKGQGLKIVDDYTFTIELTAPHADYPLRLGYSGFDPLPSVAYDDIAAFGQNPIGNGPYMFDGDDAWQHNEQISLVKNPDYTGPREAKNGGLTIKFYATLDAAYADLLSDNLDVLDAIPTGAYTTFEADLDGRSINQPAAIFQSITIPSSLDNLAHPEAYTHFQGEEGKLRRAAISMAINRDEITDKIFNGTRTPAHDFTSPTIDGYSETVPGSDVLEFNADKAKDLWAQADAISPWTGTFTIGYNADGGHQEWVDAVANSIKNTLGIDAAGSPYPDFASIRTLITKDDAGKRQIADSAFRTGWQADYPGLFNFLGPIYGTGAGSNDGDYSNSEFDDLLAQGSAATSPADANALFQKAQEILFKDLPAIPLWYSSVQGGYSTSVDNVKFGWNSVPLFSEITKK